MTTKTCIMLFHRDLRCDDNTSLLQAVKDGYKILPVFVFTPTQIDPAENLYFSNNSVQFMVKSLIDLNEQIKKQGGYGMLFMKGDTINCLEKIRKQKHIDAFYTNADYTHYSQKRDHEIELWCKKYEIIYKSEEDYGLLKLHEGLLDARTNQERPYVVLAQFFRHILEHQKIRNVEKFKGGKFVKISDFNNRLEIDDLNKFYEENPNIAVKGGRTNALKQMEHIKTLQDYQHGRDYPAMPKTSMMSAYLRFGNVSIREMYWYIQKQFGQKHGLIRELIFREFYMKIYALKPELQRGIAFHDKLDKAIPWSYDKKLFNAWCQGKTGFPIVDAGMRQLNTIGWQHNRVRMITSNILTKYFLIDWRLGEKYFAKQLVDYDRASNNLGWQWSSSVGPDPILFFRAPFNPYIQSKKFDKDAEYIKKWVPELEEVDPKDIHKWDDEKIRAKYPTVSYPAPLVDQKEASRRAVKIYKEAFEKSKK